jgi:hypothetical protein
MARLVSLLEWSILSNTSKIASFLFLALFGGPLPVFFFNMAAKRRWDGETNLFFPGFIF